MTESIDYRSPFRQLARVLLLGLLIGQAPRSADARVIVDFDATVKAADAIGIARVTEIATLDGVKVARATIIRPLRGVAAESRVAFVAEPTWSCDTSWAVVGETVLLVLDTLPAQPFEF